MPLIVAAFIRVLIQAAVTTGIFTVAEKLLSPLVDAAKSAVKNVFNMTDEEAEDSIANEIIDAFAMIGILGITIKTKIPTKVAEKLRFTSKGYSKRKISAKLPAGAVQSGAKTAMKNTTGNILTTAEATPIVENAIKNKLGFKAAYDIGLKTLGVTFLGFMTVGNWLDFGNWNSGAYQKSMQKFIAWISFGTIVPDQDYRKSKTVSDDIFSKVFNTFQLGGAQGIQDPYKGVDVPFTRDNLMDLLDQVGASLLLSTGAASTKNVLKAALPMIIFDATVDLDKVLGAVQVPSGTSTQSVAVAPITKVFTGIVSQGVVGQGLVFTPRPDDMIESADELRQAAANNLAPYLNTLLGKIVYEVKVVSRIVSKEGFVQTGTTQRIKTGTYADGSPKYKTVTNKFATLVVYALTDKGSRAKLTTIVLGPTDSAKLTVAQTDLRTLEGELPALVTTNNLGEIKEIDAKEPIKVNTPSVQEYEKKGVVVTTNDEIEYYKERGYKIEANPSNPRQALAFAPIGGTVKAPTTTDKAPDDPSNKFNTATGKPNPKYKEPSVVPAPITAPLVSTTATKPTGAGANATTLFEWFKAQGQSLPSVSIRSALYQEMGLGSKSYYTGTAEQNTKLLQALKGATNVASSTMPIFKSIITDTYLQAS